MAQPASSTTGSSMSVHPSRCESQSSAGRGRGRGRGSSSCVNQNRIYALMGRLDWESSPDVVTSILTICSHDAYALIDPGSTLSYITPFVAGKFGIVPDILSDHFAVSTPIGESIIARRVYRGCTVTVCSRQTSADLVELEMMDFDAIIGMDWLAACYATVYCRAKAARFHFPGEAVLEWVGNTATPKEDEHVDHLRVILETLCDRKLYAKFSKCEFWLKSVAFLGNIVSDEGIKVDAQKIEDVKSWPRPTTPTEFIAKWKENKRNKYNERQLGSKRLKGREKKVEPLMIQQVILTFKTPLL
ncbi:uncharacterized protein [Nicotiana tomentosiformis]|uniref:uncharacterized protein n=1 Tax=Nicotiana tomentosiformis TaxID=4098 RepID=UPI00388C9BD2